MTLNPETLRKFVVCVSVSVGLCLGGCQFATYSPLKMANGPRSRASDRELATKRAISKSLIRVADSGSAQASGEEWNHPAGNGSLRVRIPQPVYTLDQCRNVAISNNPGLQVEVWKELVNRAMSAGAKVSLLPTATFSGQLANTGNHAYGNQDDVEGWFFGLEDADWAYFFEARWSPTDALLNYYLSKNACNDLQKARLQRIRMTQRLLGLVESTYFRLLSCQSSMDLAQQLTKARRSVASQTKRLVDERLAFLEDYHEAEKKAENAQLVYNRIRAGVQQHKVVLATLMGMSLPNCLDGAFQVAGPLNPPTFSGNPCLLETQALQWRPETQINGLELANATNELMRRRLAYLPKTTGFVKFGQQQPRYPYGQTYNDVGVFLSVDLRDLIGNYYKTDAANAQRSEAYHKQSAKTLAIISEVRSKALRCFEAEADLQVMDASIKRAAKRLDVANGKESLGMLEKVAVQVARADLLELRIERLRALGEANARAAELACAVGMNYTPSSCH